MSLINLIWFDVPLQFGEPNIKTKYLFISSSSISFVFQNHATIIENRKILCEKHLFL